MTKADIIKKFHLFMDDSTDLSDTEESDLFDKIYNEVCMDRPWEFLRTSFAGTTSITSPNVSLPSDFGFVLQNNNYTDDTDAAHGPVVFVDTTYSPYKIVSMSDRRRYRNQDGYAYIDIKNNNLVFTLQPTAAKVVEFDYAATPPALATGGTPLFPARFHDIIYHYMCIDAFILDQSDKAKSYAAENKTRGDQYLANMAYWNANLAQLD